MKEIGSKLFKFFAASIGLLVTAYTIGWSGAITLHNLFKTEKAEAMHYVEKRIDETKAEMNAIHKSDMDGLNGKLNILIDQNKLIISQNFRTRKAIEQVAE